MAHRIVSSWCEPTHHRAEGKTDPTKIKLKSPFVAVISGGSEGIGLGCATALAKAGASAIVIASRSASKLKVAEAQIKLINPEILVTSVPSDVTKNEDVKNLASVVKEKHGRLDCLILAAGISSVLIERNGELDWPSNFHEAPLDDTDAIMNLNVLAQWHIVHYFMPLLEDTKDGPQTLVLLSSGAAHATNTAFIPASYSLSKFSATRLIELVDDAHHKNGVNSFALHPGAVNTPMAKGLPPGKGWDKHLIDDVELAGGFISWLVQEKRDWLSGRYVDSHWDVEELVKRKEKILSENLLKFKLAL